MFWVGANKYLGTDGKPETHICFVFALITEALPGLFGGEQGNKGIYFRRTREQRCKTEGNRGTNAILGNREHRTSRFGFQELENSVYFSRNRCHLGGPLWVEQLILFLPGLGGGALFYDRS